MQHPDTPSQAHLDSPDVTFFVLAVFTATYAGMALGRFPGLRIDRTGIALVAVIVLLASGAVHTSEIAGAIDFPTLFILFGLMILSAQFAAAGFYDWCALRVATAKRSWRMRLNTDSLTSSARSMRFTRTSTTSMPSSGDRSCTCVSTSCNSSVRSAETTSCSVLRPIAARIPSLTMADKRCSAVVSLARTAR